MKKSEKVSGHMVRLDEKRSVWIGRLKSGEYWIRYIGPTEEITEFRLSPEALRATVGLAIGYAEIVDFSVSSWVHVGDSIEPKP